MSSLRIYPVALPESMVRNLAEGSRSQGGNKRVRYYNSLGGTREEVGAELVDRFDHVIGTLVRLVK